MSKHTQKQYTWVYFVCMIALLLWIFKGWKYGIGFFLTIGALAQLRVLLFTRRRIE